MRRWASRRGACAPLRRAPPRPCVLPSLRPQPRDRPPSSFTGVLSQASAYKQRGTDRFSRGRRPGSPGRSGLGLETGFCPAAEHVDLLVRPGAVAGHGAVAQALEDAGRVRLHVGLRPQVERERHGLAVALAEQRLDVRGEADRLVRPRQYGWSVWFGCGLRDGWWP